MAAPIMSSVSIPAPAPSGSAAVAWARDAAKQYERLAEETDKILWRIRGGDVRESDVTSALRDERDTALDVAKQLDELANAAASADPSKVTTTKAKLLSAARAERNAALALTKHCGK